MLILLLPHSSLSLCHVNIIAGTPNSTLPSSAQGRIISMLGDRLSNFHAALKGETLLPLLRVFLLNNYI